MSVSKSVSTCISVGSSMSQLVINRPNCVFQLALQQVILPKPTNSCDEFTLIFTFLSN